MASRLYVALIADATASRLLPPARRARLQAGLRSSLAEFNRRFRPALAARFGVTQGDELQCLLNSATPLWDVAHAIRARFADVDWVIGCGLGPVTTSLAGGRLAAPEVDGPCFHHARAAVEAAKADRQLFAFQGFGAADRTLAGFAAYYSAVYWSWTRRQRQVATAWRFAWDPHDARRPEARLEVVPSAVSHLRRRMAWPLVVTGDKMFRTLLETA